MKKILIVDDQPAVRELVSVTLEIGPYQILTAENGDQALSIARAELPELMLLDIQMPLMDGYAALAHLREQPQLAGVHIIALTAFAMSEDKLRIMQAGFDGYITKPFELTELHETVERHLNRFAT